MKKHTGLLVLVLVVSLFPMACGDNGAYEDPIPNVQDAWTPPYLNELVQRLTKEQPVETSRPEKTAKALKECIDRDYVHVMFKMNGTEMGVQLDRRDCRFNDANFETATGKVHIVGGLILNYNKVRCIADIDLATCEGTGYLEPVSDEEYERMMGQGQ